MMRLGLPGRRLTSILFPLVVKAFRCFFGRQEYSEIFLFFRDAIPQAEGIADLPLVPLEAEW